MGYHTLWLGPDHLLSIDSRRFSEDYKRFYYSDIQAFIVRKTAIGKFKNLFLALFCALFILIALSAGDGRIIFLWVVAGTFFGALLMNSLMGPTCMCHIKTAVQIEELPSLNLMRTTRKAMGRLRPLIEAAQGRLTREELGRGLSAESYSGNPSAAFQASVQVLRHEPGRFHYAFSLLLLAGGLFTGVSMIYNNMVVTLLMTCISMGTGACVIIALVKQQKSDVNDALRTVTWSALGYVCLDFIMSYIIYFIVIVKNPKIANNQLELFKAFSSISPLESPWLTGLYLFCIACSLGLGISGLVFLKRTGKGSGMSSAVAAALFIPF